jgi:ectoine hydroxylase-related dioxygenase (phytanoyl-CoA dioxygenase family)
MSAVLSAISEAQRQQYQTEGYFVAESYLPPELLDSIRAECDKMIVKADAEMAERGVEQCGLNYRGRRYFICNRHAEYPGLKRFLFGEAMAELCRATIGPNAYLFFEQFVVKGPDKRSKFSWHQDSGYVGHPHEPYLTCWVALDDVSEENGTVYVLPYSRAGTRDLVPHRKDPELNDMVGYFGDDPGEPVLAPAGSVACFSSTTFHRSGANLTPRFRRAYVVQYSKEPLRNLEGGEHALAIPFLRDGRIVTA